MIYLRPMILSLKYESYRFHHKVFIIDSSTEQTCLKHVYSVDESINVILTSK